MKKLTPIFLILLCQSFFVNTTRAQLVAGDIAFTGYLGAATVTDEFSFVVLTTISGGTTINFTDNAWLNTGSLRGGETTITWTAPAGLALGSEIKIVGTVATRAGGGAAGTVTGTPLAFSTSGDQILAYTGTAASPTFISGIHMNVYQSTSPISDPVDTDAANWDNTNSNNSNASALPPGLITGTNAIWVGTFQVSASEFDNAVFNCTGPLTTVAQIRTAVNNPANWIKSNGAPVAPVVTPSGCTFLGVTAVSLVNFSVKLKVNNSAFLQWKVEEYYNINKFTIEKSTDGIFFKSLTTLNASSSTNGTYYYTDNDLVTQNNYYRIKIIELSGKSFYSNIVSVNSKSVVVISVYPNPVIDKLTIQQFGNQYNKIAYLYAATGKIVQQINITSQQHSINIKYLAAGVYYLKMNDGKVFKIIKQ